MPEKDMNNYHPKNNQNSLQGFELVEELTPQEIEVIKGGLKIKPGDLSDYDNLPLPDDVVPNGIVVCFPFPSIPNREDVDCYS